jgi:shikimate kinase
VFLDAPVEELWARAQAAAGTRPLAVSENHFRQLYAQRRSRYMEADHHVQTGGRPIEEIAAEIAALLFPSGQGESR